MGSVSFMSGGLRQIVQKEGKGGKGDRGTYGKNWAVHKGANFDRKTQELRKTGVADFLNWSEEEKRRSQHYWGGGVL